MKVWCFVIFGILVAITNADSNDFSEFDAPEDFDVTVTTEKPQTVTVSKTDDIVFGEDEFSPTADDEFDGQSALDKDKEPSDEQKKINPLTFADIPAHFRSNWSSYQVEAVMLSLIIIYGLNFLLGKTKNYSLATKWYSYSAPILEQQFALVGDDGVSQEVVGGKMMKDTESSYSVWSSGRVGCQGMLSQLKLVKRQDLLGLAMNLLTPRCDRVVHRVELDVGEMDTFVIAFGVRKSVMKIVKEYTDLGTFTSEKKNVVQFGLPSSFAVYAEVSECVSSIVDQATQQFFRRYERYIDCFHFSDQYCGQKPTEENLTKLPDTVPTLIFSYNMHEGEQSEEIQQALLQFTFHTIERIRRYRLSREGKSKADKKRKSVEESFLKNTHQQRQEAAQARREEKTRERKQRLLEEEDPDKQRRLQKIEDRKENKLRQPKLKQLRVK